MTTLGKQPKENLYVLQGLHTLLAEYFKRELEASMEEDGFPIPSVTLDVIVTLLKNNNITVDIKDDADIEDLRAKITKRKVKNKDERASNLIEVADSVGVMGQLVIHSFLDGNI